MQPVALVVFTRAPEPGKVKTRLIPAIGRLRSSALHEALVRRTVRCAVQSDVGPVHLACTPTTNAPLFRTLELEFGVALQVQVGKGLGERMHAALATALSTTGADGAIVLGTDIPLLHAADLRAAAAWLADGVPAVLGPAVDGGYYLIGLRRPCRAIFDGMPWGSASVCERTRRRLVEHNLRWREAPLRSDLDRPADLHLLPAAGLALDGGEQQ